MAAAMPSVHSCRSQHLALASCGTECWERCGMATTFLCFESDNIGTLARRTSWWLEQVVGMMQHDHQATQTH